MYNYHTSNLFNHSHLSSISQKLAINKLFLRVTIESIVGSNDFGAKDVESRMVASHFYLLKTGTSPICKKWLGL